MKVLRSIRDFFHGNRNRVLAANAALIFLIAFVDRLTASNVSLGFLYLFPMLVSGHYLSPRALFLQALVCAILRETFAPWAWQADATMREIMATCAFFGAGFFTAELTRARRVAEEQSRLRQDAEAQLRALIESSPAAILTVDAQARVLLANEAAHRLLGFGGETLAGQTIGDYLPVLTSVPRSGSGRPIRSAAECTGRRRDGEVFLAHVWFSTYQTHDGPRLAAIVWDGSEELRDREGLSLRSIMSTSQILVRAALHEIRNLGAAAAVAHANLARVESVVGNEDFQALGTLVKGLEKIASSELRIAADRPPATAELHTVLDELRIVIEPSFREDGIEIRWDLDHDLPPVRADHQGLLQVFLNLAQNSRRAMQDAEHKRFTVSVASEHNSVLLRFQDTGRGVPVPDRLFQPLQAGAEATGLGLYISRAIVRSFAGELRYEPQPLGSCFTVQLAPARAAATAVA